MICSILAQRIIEKRRWCRKSGLAHSLPARDCYAIELLKALTFQFRGSGTMNLTRILGFAGIVAGASALLLLAGCGQNGTKQAAGGPPTLFEFEDYMDPP